MNNLKKKVFTLIFSILSISILGFIIVFNGGKYLEYNKIIGNSLRNLSNNEENKNKVNKDNIFKNNNIRYMDKIIYTLLLNNDNSIKEVINLSNNNIDIDSIKLLGQSILNNNNIKKEYIGNIYFNKYSYIYSNSKYLIIIDNSSIQNSLYNYLLISLSLFILFEVIVYLISMILTSWIIKPVIRSFEAQKEFIADASHELKTPLSVIMASSEALEDNPKEVKWLNNIKSEANRMNILIKNLLELASLKKKETYVLKEGNLSKIVDLAVLTFDAKGNPTKLIPERTKRSIATLDFVKNCEVITVPDAKVENTAIAYVVVKDGIVADEDLKRQIIDNCMVSVPEYMVPSDVVFIDEMPLNASKKPNLIELKKMYQNNNAVNNTKKKKRLFQK